MSQDLSDLSLQVWKLHDLALRHDTGRLEGLTRREARTQIAAAYPAARQAVAMAAAGLDMGEALTEETSDHRHTIRGLELMLNRVAETLGLVAPGAPLKKRAA